MIVEFMDEDLVLEKNVFLRLMSNYFLLAIIIDVISKFSMLIT